MTAASFDRAVDAFGATVAALPERSTGVAAEALQAEAAARSPVRTGRLRAGWTIDRSGGPVVRVVNDVPYASLVEYGARGRPGIAMARGAVVAVAAALGDRIADLTP
ncbi:MAG: HK97 gp10 family phage protein [Alphaproteobacteria bacterium]